MSRLLRPIALLAVLVAAVAVAGCGGQKVAADEVPGDPVNLTVPEVTKGGSAVLAGNGDSSSNSSSSSSSSSSADTQADAEATPTATPGSSTTQPSGTSGTTQSGTTGGTGTTQQQTQTQQNGNSGTSGNSTGKPFDDFCKNNPGAC